MVTVTRNSGAGRVLAWAAGLALLSSGVTGLDAQNRKRVTVKSDVAAAVTPVAATDLVPVTDGGKFLTFQNREEWRYAFWARNAGAARSKPSRIRLKVFYRHAPMNDQEPPWTQHADVFLNVPSLGVGEESRAMVSRILYPDGGVIPTPPSSTQYQYKWEFVVDDGAAVAETNEANNLLTHRNYHAAGKFETGPSGGFH